MLDTFATAKVVVTSRYSPVSAAPAEGQSTEACRDSEADPTSGAVEAPDPDFVCISEL